MQVRGWREAGQQWHGDGVVLSSPEDTIGDLKKLVALQIGTRPEKLVIKRQQYRCSRMQGSWSPTFV